MENLPPVEPRRGFAVELIAHNARLRIAASYGIESGNPLPYHYEQHFDDVTSATDSLASVAIECGKLTPQQKDIALIAASVHDIHQEFGPGPNEHFSLVYGWKQMAKHGCFDHEDFWETGDAVLSTQVSIEPGGAIRQQLTGDSYVAKIVADADLASLGRPPEIYWDRATALHREFHPGVELVGENMTKFAIWQLVVLRNHGFYTAEADELFPHKSANIAFVESILRACAGF